MPRYPALLCSVLIALVAAFLIACGGSDDTTTAGIIHRMLQAAGAEDSGGLESFPGRLPDDLPVPPPLYPGADLIVSSQQTIPLAPAGDVAPPGGFPRPILYFIVLNTGADRNAVFSYYEEALDEDPWQVEASAATQGLDTIEFVNVGDIDISGAVSITSGGTDGKTTILISLQDAGAFVDELPPFELGETLIAPKDFPTEVPLYSDATITGSAFFREPGNESFLLIFLTTDSQADVIDFYQAEFEDHGLTVQPGNSIGLEDIITFFDDVRDIQGEVVAERFSEDRDFTEVRIQVQVNPARQPLDSDDESDAE